MTDRSSIGPADAPPLVLLHGSAGASPHHEIGFPAYAEWLDDVEFLR